MVMFPDCLRVINEIMSLRHLAASAKALKSSKSATLKVMTTFSLLNLVASWIAEISSLFLLFFWLTGFVMCLQIVLENSSREDKHECPFGRSSIELTKMLCEILKVGELRKSPHS